MANPNDQVRAAETDVAASDAGQANDAEIEKRRDLALLRALSTPHKTQKEMKIGKGGREKRKRADGQPEKDTEG
jgi:hypothetical protein